MIYDGITREKGRADRIKYICPKTLKICSDGTTTYSLNCENPCTPSKMAELNKLLFIIITGLIHQCLEIA